MAQHLRDNSHIASRFGQEQAQVPQPHLHLEQLRGHNDGLSPARDRSISPGVESHMTHGSTLGEGEKVILNSVIARLQHGIDHAGRSRDGLPRGPGGMNVASPPHTDVTGVTPQSVELRQQLDRAGMSHSFTPNNNMCRCAFSPPLSHRRHPDWAAARDVRTQRHPHGAA